MLVITPTHKYEHFTATLTAMQLTDEQYDLLATYEHETELLITGECNAK
jgi:hypothetical protein